MAYELDNGRVVCEQCGNDYERIAAHWSKNPTCEHPTLSQHQMEIATGLLMGDGTICRTNKNPHIEIKMISPNYLEYVAEGFGVFGGPVKRYQTAEESAQKNRNSGFSSNAKAENYSDLYQWWSMSHPDLQSLVEWYDSGKKVWPDDINLTPTVLKHWYCGDGSWHNSGHNNYIRIAMSNEVESTDKIDKYFERVGLPSPSNYSTNERENGSLKCDAAFTVEQSQELWEYMGESLPDFEYKWPESYQGVEEQKTATASS